MMEKVLNCLIKVSAVIIIGVILIVGNTLHKNKYMLVQGAEQTLESSIYSSKDLEIAISSLNLADNSIKVTVKNKSDKKINIKLEELDINSIEYKTDINLDVNEYSISEQLATIAKTTIKGVDKPTLLDGTFMVDDKYNIDISVAIGSNTDD